MAEEPRKTLGGWFARKRNFIQALFLFAWLLPLGSRLHNVCGPVFHCYACPLSTFACPIGVIAQMGALHLFPFMAVGTLLVVGGLFGAFVCGWACPFGYLQDLASKVPTPRVAIPRIATYARYLVLAALVLAIPYVFGNEHPLFICSVCPAGAIEGAGAAMAQAAAAGQPVAWPNAAKLAVTGAFVVAIFFMHRPWCSVLCPLGAVYSLFNRGSAFYLKFAAGRCTDCKLCHKYCRHGVRPNERANDLRCIRCLECTKCPFGALGAGSAFSKSTSDD